MRTKRVQVGREKEVKREHQGGKKGAKRRQKGGNLGTHGDMAVEEGFENGAKRWRPWGTHRAKRGQ